MKFLALILSFLILFLAIGPAVNAIISSTPSQVQCCSCKNHRTKINTGKQKKEKKDCPTAPFRRGCCGECNGNPFTLYQCCIGFIVINASFQLSPITFFYNKSCKLKSNILSQFRIDFWHPPQDCLI